MNFRRKISSIVALVLLTSVLGFTWDAPKAQASASAGSWSSVENWPILPIHATITSDGEVLTFGADAPPASATGYGPKRYDVWEPETGTHTTVSQDSQDYFCSITLNVPDTGQTIIAGGDDFVLGSTGNALSSVYDPATAKVTALPPMATPRWYPTATVLPDGDIVVQGGLVGGSTYGITPEIYSPSSGWSSLGGATSNTVYGVANGESRWFYPRSWVDPNGDIFGIAQSLMYTLDTAGSGAVTSHGELPVALQGRATSTSVMYEPGKILQVGGGSNTNTGFGPGLQSAAIIDITSGTPVVTQIADMNFKRQWANATVLPNGQVLVNGGSDINNSLTGVAFTSEIWDPTTQAWTVVAAESEERLYHSASVLLPDGRVLSAGGGLPGPVVNLNAQYFTPPYLFDAGGGAASRPTIEWAPEDLAFNGSFTADIGAGQNIARVTLIKTGATTHSFNADQRFLELAFTQNGDQLTVSAPANNIAATPGFYLLTVLDAAGVASESAVVSLLNGTGSATTPPSDITPPTVAITSPAAGATETGSNVTISGTAADNSAVGEVRLFVESRTPGEPVRYWDGTQWTDDRTWYPVALNSGAFNDSPALPPGEYRIRAEAEDASGNLMSTDGREITVGKVFLSSPAPLTKLISNSVTFNWTEAAGASLAGYKIQAGPTQGSNSYFDSGNIGAVTSQTVSGLPTNATDVWVRLTYTPDGGSEEFIDARYEATGQPVAIDSPSAASPLPGQSATFGWTPSIDVIDYWVWAGPTQGSRAYFDSTPLGNTTSVEVTGLPTDGSPVWVRILYAEAGQGWRSINVEYTASDGTVSASLDTPVDGSVLSGPDETFTWSGTADEYQLEIGPSAGSNTLFDSGVVTDTSASVTGLPEDSSTVWARLSYRSSGGSWSTIDQSYTAAAAAGGVGVGFDGNDSILIPNNPTLQLTGDATYELWINPTDFNQRRNPLAKAYSGEGTITQEKNGRLTFYQGPAGGNSSGYQWLQTTPITANQWTHAVIVRQNNNLTWYINGQQNTTKTGLTPPAPSPLPLIIGDGYAFNYQGDLDEIAIYNRALTPTEIQTHYNAANNDTTYATTITNDNPISYWRLNETTGPTATDQTNTNPGTYQGTPTYQQPGPTGPGTPPEPDTTPPVITLNGADPFDMEIGETFANVDPGFTVVDDQDPSPTTSVDDSAIDNNTVGTYTVTYFATDASNNSSSATRTINVITAAAGGVGVGFDGNDSILIPNNPTLQLTGDATYELWINPTDFNQRRNPLAKAYSGEGTITQEKNGRLTFYQGPAGGNSSGYQWLQTTPITANQWTHAVIVRQNNNLTWYINGQQNTTKTGLTPPAPSPLPLIIGDGYAFNYQGDLDEIAIYNRALTPTEIQTHYNAANNDTTYATTITNDNPISYWRLNETTGPTATDQTNTNPGTYQGTPTYQQPGPTG